MSVVYMIIYVNIFSFWFVLSRLGLVGSAALSPVDIIYFRYLIAGIALLPFVSKLPIKKVGIIPSMLIALCIGVLYNTLTLYGLTLFQSNHGAVVITGFMPIFSALLVLISRKPLSKNIYIALLLIVFSIILFLSNNPYGASISPLKQVLGLGLLLSSALLYSIGMWIINRYSLSPIEVITANTYFSLPSAILFFLLIGDKKLFISPNSAVLIQGLYQGIAVSILSIFLISKAIKNIGSLKTSFFIALTPVLTTLFAFLMKETISMLDVFATITCTCGIVICSVSKNLKKPVLQYPITPPK